MPKIPRDVDGLKLSQAISKFGYAADRQTGSHIRLTRKTLNNSHHITIPAHSPLKVGTLNAILGDIAGQLGITKEELIKQLF